MGLLLGFSALSCCLAFLAFIFYAACHRMSLGFSLFSSFFFLGQFSLYSLLFLVFLLCSLERSASGGRHLTTSAVLSVNATTSQTLLTLVPFFFIILSVFLLHRSYAGVAPLSTFTLTASGLAWVSFVHLVGFCLLSFVLLVGGRALHTALPEFVLALFILVFVWAWLGCVSNWLTALLMFELAALAILLTSVHLFLASPARGSSGTVTTHESAVGVELSFLKFFVFFLWLSVVATFLFFWVLAVSYETFLGFDVHSVLLLYVGLWGLSPAPSLWSVFYLSLLGLGFVFKLMLLPLQGALFSIYGVMPFSLLLVYFVFYYFFFLVISFLVFGSVFYLFWGGFGLLILPLGLFGLYFLMCTVAGDLDLRQVFAVSSTVNLTLVLLFLV